MTGVIAHIRKEIAEIREAMADDADGDAGREFIDIAMLAIDLAWRSKPWPWAPIFATAVNWQDADETNARDEREQHASPYWRRRYLLALVELHLSAQEGRRDSATHFPVWRIAEIYRAGLRGASDDRDVAHSMLLEKWELIQKRDWPPLGSVPHDQPIEHIRTKMKDAAVALNSDPPPPAPRCLGDLAGDAEFAGVDRTTQCGFTREVHGDLAPTDAGFAAVEKGLCQPTDESSAGQVVRLVTAQEREAKLDAEFENSAHAEAISMLERTLEMVRRRPAQVAIAIAFSDGAIGTTIPAINQYLVPLVAATNHMNHRLNMQMEPYGDDEP